MYKIRNEVSGEVYMSQGRDTKLSKDEIATIVGDDWHFEKKEIRKLKRLGWKDYYNSIRHKE